MFFFVNKRFSVYWGGFSQCVYQMNLIEECIKSGIDFNRVFFLSGLDYPLWSNNLIINYIKKEGELEFIKGMNLSKCYNPPKMQTRVKQYHYRDFPYISNKHIRRALYGGVRELLNYLGIKKQNYLEDRDGNKIDVYCGSCWWCLTFECLKYVYEEITQNDMYEKYFKTALAPDELMIQTVVFNSPFSKNAIIYEGVYPGLVGLTPLHYIEYDGYIPVWTESDFEKLIKSNKMFCRKVMTGRSDKLIEMIDDYRIHGKENA